MLQRVTGLVTIAATRRNTDHRHGASNLLRPRPARASPTAPPDRLRLGDTGGRIRVYAELGINTYPAYPILRKIAINLMGRSRTPRVSMRARRKQAAWNDEYMLALLAR